MNLRLTGENLNDYSFNFEANLRIVFKLIESTVAESVPDVRLPLFSFKFPYA